MAVNRMPLDDAGIPELVRRLGDDSKRLAGNEVRLAKLEVRESLHLAGRGAVRLAMAFGIGVVALVAFTVFAIALIAHLAGGKPWVGGVVVGLLELGLAVILVKRGRAAFADAPYSLEETRAGMHAITRSRD